MAGKKKSTEPAISKLAIESLTPSKTNPRKNYDAAAISDLAASIKDKGILQPIIVRIEMKVLEETKEGGVKGSTGKYEIVAGERRYRAAKQVGLEFVPCIIKDLTDAEVIETQVVENMQRADLTPLEEAEGYKTLHEKFKNNWEEIALRTGKSQEYIYSRLKLLDLIPDFKKALRDGELRIADAMQIARLTDPADQEKLYKALGAQYGMRDLEPGEVKNLITENFLLKLKTAPFPIKDKKLPGGSCGDCSKRTGAMPDLFGDLTGKDDTCRDAECFKKKKCAFESRIKGQHKHYKDSGHELIVGEKAAEILEDRNRAYDRPNESSYELKGTKTTWADALKGTDYKPAIVIDAKGKAHEYIKKSDALKVIPKTKRAGYYQPEKTKEQREKEARDTEIRNAAFETVAKETLKKIFEEAEELAGRTGEPLSLWNLIRAALLALDPEPMYNVNKEYAKLAGIKPAQYKEAFLEKTPSNIHLLTIFILHICGDMQEYDGEPTKGFSKVIDAFDLGVEFKTNLKAEIKRLQDQDKTGDEKGRKTKKKGGRK